MRELYPGEPVLVGDRVMLRNGIRVTVKEVNDDGSLLVTHRPGEETTVTLAYVWQLIRRPGSE